MEYFNSNIPQGIYTTVAEEGYRWAVISHDFAKIFGDFDINQPNRLKKESKLFQPDTSRFFVDSMLGLHELIYVKQWKPYCIVSFYYFLMNEKYHDAYNRPYPLYCHYFAFENDILESHTHENFLKSLRKIIHGLYSGRDIQEGIGKVFLSLQKNNFPHNLLTQFQSLTWEDIDNKCNELEKKESEIFIQNQIIQNLQKSIKTYFIWNTIPATERLLYTDAINNACLSSIILAIKKGIPWDYMNTFDIKPEGNFVGVLQNQLPGATNYQEISVWDMINKPKESTQREKKIARKEKNPIVSDLYHYIIFIFFLLLYHLIYVSQLYRDRENIGKKLVKIESIEQKIESIEQKIESIEQKIKSIEQKIETNNEKNRNYGDMEKENQNILEKLRALDSELKNREKENQNILEKLRRLENKLDREKEIQNKKP